MFIEEGHTVYTKVIEYPKKKFLKIKTTGRSSIETKEEVILNENRMTKGSNLKKSKKSFEKVNLRLE